MQKLKYLIPYIPIVGILISFLSLSYDKKDTKIYKFIYDLQHIYIPKKDLFGNVIDINNEFVFNKQFVLVSSACSQAFSVIGTLLLILNAFNLPL